MIQIKILKDTNLAPVRTLLATPLHLFKVANIGAKDAHCYPDLVNV